MRPSLMLRQRVLITLATVQQSAGLTAEQTRRHPESMRHSDSISLARKAMRSARVVRMECRPSGWSVRQQPSHDAGHGAMRRKTHQCACQSGSQGIAEKHKRTLDKITPRTPEGTRSAGTATRLQQTLAARMSMPKRMPVPPLQHTACSLPVRNASRTRLTGLQRVRKTALPMRPQATAARPSAFKSFCLGWPTPYPAIGRWYPGQRVLGLQSDLRNPAPQPPEIKLTKSQ
jgi:hypothetical protein